MVGLGLGPSLDVSHGGSSVQEERDSEERHAVSDDEGQLVTLARTASLRSVHVGRSGRRIRIGQNEEMEMEV